MIIRNEVLISSMTLEASSLSNRGFGDSRTPGQLQRHTKSTLKGCPISYIPLVIFHSTLLQHRNQLITSRDLMVVLLLVDDILHHALFVCLGVCQRTIALLPFHKMREAVAVGRHEIISGYFDVMHERGHSYGGVESYEHVYMVGHTIDTVENTS